MAVIVCGFSESLSVLLIFIFLFDAVGGILGWVECIDMIRGGSLDDRWGFWSL